MKTFIIRSTKTTKDRSHSISTTIEVIFKNFKYYFTLKNEKYLIKETCSFVCSTFSYRYWFKSLDIQILTCFLDYFTVLVT